MIDLGALAAFIRARLDEEERDARAAIEESNRYYVGAKNTGAWQFYEALILDGADAAIIGDIDGHRVEEGYGHHIARQNPAATLFRVEALRAMVADIRAERHFVDHNDCWNTCAVATEEHDGGSSCNDARGSTCDCNRDGIIGRRLRFVAAFWRYRPDGSQHPDWREEWTL